MKDDEVALMGRRRAGATSKRFSLVYSLEEALSVNTTPGGPEPDYLKWLNGLLFAEIGVASDEAAGKGNSPEDRAAWKVYIAAVSATQELMELQQRNSNVFQKVASHFSVLPCLMSRHPDTERFNRQLFEKTPLGKASLLCEQAPHGRHHAHQSWPVRYAYALIRTIHLTLDTWEDRIEEYAEIYGYGIKHPISAGEAEALLAQVRQNKEKIELRRTLKEAYRVLPKWTKHLDKLRRPLNQDSVLGYWRKGKEIMLEEMPDFHLRPEWKSYLTRTYRDGAKDGIIQHAIFKDILAALKAIAGQGEAKTGKVSRKSKGARG